MVGYPYYDEVHGIYTHPQNYKKLLNKYKEQGKDLKICLAHFGGDEEWSEYLNEPAKFLQESRRPWGREILAMIEAEENGKQIYPHLYTDISYTSYSPDTLALLKVHSSDHSHKYLHQRMLFGSDFPVLQAQIADRSFAIKIRGYLGEKLFKQIAWKNPRRFLETGKEELVK